MTFGWVLGEVVRRTDPRSRPFGRFVQEEICAPLGLDSLWLGVPDAELERVATLELDDSTPAGQLPPERLELRARVVPPQLELVPDVYNRRDVLQACIPATGLTANARSLARLFALYANGGRLGGSRLLSEERVRSLAQPRAGYDEVDQTNFRVMPVGSRGFWLADVVAGSKPGLICNVGAGGAVGWADLETGLAVGICHNRMFAGKPAGEHPLVPLGDAVRALAGELRAAPAERVSKP
jgi:CubicO group peptidase (beta-lactamase class C family)